MYPRNFSYHRASSLPEAARMLSQLGPDAKLLAGGQSLIPLMKMRLANPAAIVDLGHIGGLGYIRQDAGVIAFGALSRHADVERSDVAGSIPILHDCAAGIADPQVRNWGTVAGSIAEADPTGDWAPVLLALDCEISCVGVQGERTLPLSRFIRDAFTTALAADEVIREVRVRAPGKDCGGAYLAFKRCAPVYASASAAVQLRMADGLCAEARIVLGAVGLTPVHAAEAEAALRGKRIDGRSIASASEGAAAAADPQSDQRGSAEYKRTLVRALVSEAIDAAARRATGARVEVAHHYA